MARRKLKTPTEYARAIGVSPARVSYLKRNGKLKMNGAKIDHEASIRLYEQRVASQKLTAARMVLDHYRAKLAKLEFEKTAGQLVDVSTVQQEWRRAVLRIKSRLLGLGRELGPLLHGRRPIEIKTVIDHRIF